MSPSHWDDEAPEIIERLELSFDINELRLRMRRVLAISERLSAVPDSLATGHTTPAEVRATTKGLESAVHLLDDQLRFIIPGVAEALHLDIGHGCDEIEPW